MLTCLGNNEILKSTKIAFFSSRICPPYKITKIYDWAIKMRDGGKTIISGFHTPIEHDVLKYLLKGKQPIIICPARSVNNMKIPVTIKKANEENRILFISPFEDKIKKQTKQTAILRNEFVAKTADQIVIGHAEPGGNVDSLIKKFYTKEFTFI